MCFVAGDINFDHMLKMISVRFLHIKEIYFP